MLSKSKTSLNTTYSSIEVNLPYQGQLYFWYETKIETRYFNEFENRISTEIEKPAVAVQHFKP